MNQNIIDQIESSINGEVSTEPADIEKYSHDASLFEVKPKLIVFPKNAGDIQQVISIVNQHHTRDPSLSITARSAGTCMSGGSLNESIIVDVNKHMTKVNDVVETSITTEPGAFYRDFEQATLKQNLIMPSYPASREICSIGGMVANNSGGEKTLSYGKTEDYVQEIKMLLHNGEEYTFRKLSESELEAKCQQADLEGDLYRNISTLVKDNHDILQAAKPKVSKNSAGYFLWNVWDPKERTFDLTKLIVGSQGTFGIITEATFRLVTPKPRSQMLVMLLPELDQLGDIIQRVLSFEPESFESYDDHTMKIAMKFLPDMIKQMKAKNVISLGLQFLPEVGMMLTGGVPKLILIAEFTGHDPEELKKRAEATKQALAEFDIKVRLTKSEEEAKKYWTMRRESFSLLRQHVHNKRTAPFIDDIVVRPERLSEFLPHLNEIMSQYDITYTIAGHVGDGNFHIIPLMDVHRPDFAEIIEKLGEQVYDLTVEYDGSIDGEHNDGLIRTPYLNRMYSAKVLDLFKQTKHIFDPNNIFNPGKKVSTKEINWQFALDHLVKD